MGEKKSCRGPNSRICLKEINGTECELLFCGVLPKIERHILLEKEVVAKHLSQSQMKKANECYKEHCQGQG